MINKSYSDLIQENASLKAEIERLRKQIAELQGAPGHSLQEQGKKVIAPKPLIPQLSLEERVALFRTLFRGREDVFARRWYSKTTGKSGYQPVCENEWRRPLCDKKKFKCADCPNRQLRSISYQDFYNHLCGNDANGADVIGCYAILPDNKCYFLCADFDDKSCKHGYKNDVLAYVGICKSWKIPCHIERSRSGNGAHVWIFFDDAVNAASARRLGFAILTEAMNRDGRMSLQSYDRFFPNQDTMPEGGFGNLVALPLQGQARKHGNSVFVGEHFEAYADQWAYLQQAAKVSASQLRNLLSEHGSNVSIGELSKSSESKPWEQPTATFTASDFPTEITLTRANMLYVPIKGTPAPLLNFLKRLSSFKNPEFYAKQAMRFPTYNIPRIITCAEILEDYMAIPRGCEDAVVELLHDNNVKVGIEDKTQHGHPIKGQFKGQLKSDQQEAVDILLNHSNGVLNATTAFGKTVAAIGLIAARKTNTLILVHNKALLDQWKERLCEFLETDFPIDEPISRRGRRKVYSPFGTLDSRGNSLHGHVDIALMQSCISEGEVKDFVSDYGMVIVDECHHVSAVNFEAVLKQVRARYVYGLSATPIRKDGHQPIIFMQCGPIRYSSDATAQMAAQAFQRFLSPRFTSFRMIGEENPSYTDIAEKIAEDFQRNQQIVDDVKEAVENDRCPIVLSNRTAHVMLLAEMLKDTADHIVILIGADTAKEKREKMERLAMIPPSESLVIVATDKYIGEGFDYPRLDTLFMAMPISWRGNVQQYVGRLHRNYDGKKEVRAYDYIDLHVPMCNTMYKRRMKGYKASGYNVLGTMANGSSVSNSLFSSETYQVALLDDLNGAMTTVVLAIYTTYISINSPIYHIVKTLVLRGVRMEVFAKRSTDKDFVWQDLGIIVHIDEQLSIQSAIIDGQTVWYGDVNIFGKNQGDENVIRMVDGKLASELSDMLYGN